MHAGLRHATGVAAVLCLLLAGRADGQDGYGIPKAATELVAPLTPTTPTEVPLTVTPAAPSFQQPEVTPVPDEVTTDPVTQQPEFLPLITNPSPPEPIPAEQAAPANPAESSSWYYAPVTPAAGKGKLDADGEPTNGLSGKAIDNILKEHNVFRHREHVPPLKWNATVAEYAQHYAEERKGDCALEHSDGRQYGENLMYGTGKALTWKHTVDKWSDEKKSYHHGSNSCDPGKMCGHYTAVVWKDTTDVGCGRVTCDSGDNLMVCSYWPPGNYDGVKPY